MLLGFSGGSSAAEPSPDLAMIPHDAAGFVTVDFAQLWDSTSFVEVRKLIDKLKADDALRQTFGFRFNEIERLTLVMPTAGRSLLFGPEVVFLVTTKKPLSKSKILDAMEADSGNDPGIRIDPMTRPVPPIEIRKDAKEAKDPLSDCQRELEAPERDSDAVVYYSRRMGSTLLFIGDRTVMFVPMRGDDTTLLGSYLALSLNKAKTGKMSAALQEASNEKHLLVGSLNLAAITKLFGKEIPMGVPGRGLLGAEVVTLTLDLGKTLQSTLTLEAGDNDKANEVERGLKELIEVAKELLPEAKKEWERDEESKALLPLLVQTEASLKATTIKTTGKKVTVNQSIEGDQVFASMIAQSVIRVQQVAERTTFINNFKQLAIAIHNYESAYASLPIPGYNKKGEIAASFDEAKLSWRVALLPYLEEENLFREFKLDQPWDSEHNKKLIPKMPKVYAARKSVNPKEGHTFVQMFQGKDALQPRATFAQVTDGLSNTILFIEAGEGVIWTKPDDLKFDVNKEIPKLGGNFKGDFIVAMGDGSVRFVKRNKVSDKTLKLLIQPNDGMVIPEEWNE
jgi:hypothetical protein